MIIRPTMTLAIARANDAYRAAQAAAVRTVRAWQLDLMRDHPTQIYSSPGRASLPDAAPAPTRRLVQMSNAEYVLYTDGSFRGRTVYERRPTGLSGRQRRIGRKLLRRMSKNPHAQVAALLAQHRKP